jgi:hypothetical protein
MQSKNTAVTALVKLLPQSREFISGSWLTWQRCEGGLSGHALYEECVQTKNGACAKKVCCYEFGFKVSCVNRNYNSILLIAFSHSCFVAAFKLSF